MNLQEFFLQLLKISLSASLVAGLVMLIRILFRKAPRGLVCALWLLLAVRLLIPSLPESKVSVLPESLSSGSVVKEAANTYTEDIIRVKSDDPSFMGIVERRDAIPKRDGNGQVYVTVSRESYKAPKTLGETWFPVLTKIWLAGAGLMLLYMAWTYFKVWRKTRLSVHQEGNVYFCDEPGTPFVFGLFRLRIYVPSTLSDQALACVLAHERAHIARKDPLWKLFGFLLLSLHWFNPILWLSYILLCRDMEKACDERAIRGQSWEYRKSYTGALLALSAPRHWINACPMAFGEVGVKERVKAALRYKKPSKWVVAAMAAVCLIAAGCALTDPKGTTNTDLKGTTNTDQPKTTATENHSQETTAGSIKGKYNRYQIYAREGDAAGDGWITTFIYEDWVDRGGKSAEEIVDYQYNIYNVWYWDHEPVICFYVSHGYHGPLGTQSNPELYARFTDDPEGLERDLALIAGLLQSGTEPETLLALDPATVEFEVLDKDQFFRLMRRALTGEIREPERQRSFDGLDDENFFREPIFLDGYAFRVSILWAWGFMDEVYIDLALGNENEYVLLSDLVEQGKATAEQQEAYALMRQIAENLKGREYEPNYGAESYKDTVIGTIDFGRLYTMMNDLMNEIWPEAYYLPREEVTPESLPMVNP
ncbi:MAG: M56 family metallopeptidase [Lachnospiraceae bacterium]|nr:M56 family metallopeptidase [Lachnospiraceae bacterium]